MSSGEGCADENSTISIKELSGIGRSSDEKCWEAKALISDTWQKSPGESLAPKTRPIGMTRKPSNTKEWAQQASIRVILHPPKGCHKVILVGDYVFKWMSDP